MTEEPIAKDGQTEETKPPPPEAAPEAPPPEIDLPTEKSSILKKLNPLNLFRKETPEMFVKEGNNLLDNQNAAQATMAFQRALGMDENCVDAYKGLGNVYMRKGGKAALETALENFNEAVKRNPFDDNLYSSKARIYEKMGKLKEATLERKKMMIIKTLESDPKNPIANNNMGILLTQQNQIQPAIEYFTKSISSNPKYDVAIRNLSATYYRLATKEENEDKKRESLEKAKSYIYRALEINHTVQSLILLGKIFLQEERAEEALGISDKAEGVDASNKEVFALKKMVLEKLNRMQEAQEAYETYQALSR